MYVHLGLTLNSEFTLVSEYSYIVAMNSCLIENDTSVVCDRQSVCPGGTVRCVCATGNSNTLAWSTNRNRLVLTPDDPPLTRLDVSASAVLTDRSNRSGVVVITSNLTVAASMSDTSLLAMCENVDRSTLNAVSIPVSGKSQDYLWWVGRGERGWILQIRSNQNYNITIVS